MTFTLKLSKPSVQELHQAIHHTRLLAIPSPNSENGQNGVEAKNQAIDFIGLSKSHFCQKWLKIQIGEGIINPTCF
jgi:hypothetical protein